MDQARLQERRDAARRKLERARERAVRARTRALALPIALFGILWVAVFAQMATGNDPTLGSSQKLTNATGATKADRGTAAAGGAGSSAQPQQQQSATVLAYDPVTGTIVQVPASGAQTTTPAPAPAPPPAPVVTSQS